MKTETLLLQMRAEQREDHKTLSEVVTAGFERVSNTMQAHAESDVKMFAAFDKRLTPVESMRRTVRWAIACVFTSGLLMMGDIIVHHFTKAHP